MAPAEHSKMEEGPYQAALSEIALRENARYKAETVPLMQRFQREVNTLGSVRNLDRAAGLAQGGMATQADKAIQGGLRQVPLTGGAGMARLADSRAAAGKAVGMAGYGARVGQQDARLSGMESALAMARGQQGQGVADLASVAGQAQQLAGQKALADMQESSVLGQGIGSAAGLGLAYGLGR